MGVPISNVTRRVVYAASGTGPYAFTFEILANTDIAVYRDDTLLTLTTDYTVTIAANGTGSITLVAAPTGATQIAIVGNRTIQRTTDFVTGGDFFANTINNEMDQQTIFAQQNAEGLARAMQAPQTDPTSIDMTLPRASVRAGKYLSFDNDGNPVAAEGRTEVAAVYAIRDEIAAVAAIDTEVVAVDANSANINTVAGISGNVTTVAGISANVTTVAGNNANVTSVAGNAANINTVAGSIANVNNVGGSIASVNTVAGELGAGQDVTVVAANLSGTDTIGTVAGSIANVNAVGTNIANVNAVNSNATNINTVAGISANVTTVAGVSANVTTVAGSIGAVNTNATNIVAIQNASANATAAAASASAAEDYSQQAQLSETVAGFFADSATASAATATTQASNASASAATATTQATNAAASAAAASAVALGDEPVRPLIRPSLLLDFANTKQLDPRITFTRASTGTYYDGKTVAKAEENLLLQSQAFESALWNPFGLTITANTTAAPDGTTTADTLNEGTTTGLHQVQQALFPYISGASYTQSVFAKADTATVVQMIMQSTAFGVNAFANFDLTNGVLGTVGSSATATITSVGSGWYRCTLTATATSTTTQSTGFILLCDNNTTAARAPSYTGTSRQLFLWGAQLEQRSTVTAYTPTTTQPITNYIPVLLTAASGVARFEHNPTTGESLGLEIEESRTNLMLQSQFASGWSLTRATLSLNQIVAPDGTLTGSKLVEDTTASNSHFIQRAATVTSGALHTFSVCLKSDGVRGWAALLCIGTTAANNTWFDLVNGVVGSVSANATAAITSLGNGWYRCSITVTSNSTTLTSYVSIATANSVASYTGNGFSGTYIWGAQLEAGAFPTSYIPTVASQVTRAADAASMTGTNFSSWYRADEGTLYGESTVIAFSANQTVFTISDNVGSTSTQNMNIRHSGSTSGVSRASINNSISQFDSVVNVSQGVKKLALAYQADNALFAVNGASGVVDTSVSLPNSVSQAQFGTATFLNSTLNGTIKKIAYYPVRVTNAQLQAMTTV